MELNRIFDSEKQIEEMSQIITKVCETKKIIGSYKIAETIYAKGYRKASDVAREIIADLKRAGLTESRYPVIAELKKKYTEDGK